MTIENAFDILLILIRLCSGGEIKGTQLVEPEALGFECKIGLMPRSERIILLIMGSLLGAIPVVGFGLLKAAPFVLAVSSHITAIHRMIHVRNQFLAEKKDP